MDTGSHIPGTTTYVHVRVANLLGSFYEFSTLKLITPGVLQLHMLYPVGQLFPSHNY